MSTAHEGILPPSACRTLDLDCLECPLALCLEDLRQPMAETRGGVGGKGNPLMESWNSRWPMARIRQLGRLAFVELTNGWLRGTVLPEARQVMQGKSNALGRQQAKTIVAMLGT
jgi:hypothetical protein